MKKQRLFIDMDGTLCVWRDDVTSTEELYEEGFYRNQVHQTGIGRTPISLSAVSPPGARSDAANKAAVLDFQDGGFVGYIIMSAPVDRRT